MNIDNFQHYIDHPEDLSASSIAEIQEVVLSFPYFQAAHFLYLKALYKQNSFKFNNQLKQSSVYVANRKKLYYFLKEEVEPKPQIELGKLSSEPEKEKSLVIEKPQVEILETSESKQEEKSLKTETVSKPILKEVTSETLEEKERTEINESFVLEPSPEQIEEQAESISTTQSSVSEPKKEADLVAEKPQVEILEASESQQEEKPSKAEAVIEPALKEVASETLEERAKEIAEKPESFASEVPSEKILDDKTALSVEKEEPKLDADSELEKKKPKQPDKVLSPQEILNRRIAEIKAEKAPEKEEVVSEGVSQKREEPALKEDPESKPSDNLSKALASIGMVDNDTENDDFSNFEDISDLIQVPAPVEYFTEEDIEQLPAQEEHRTFEDWLRKFQKKKGLKTQKTSKSRKNKKSDLIGRFLEDNGSKVIQPKGDEAVSKIDILPQKEEPLGDFMTETLAKIYIKQGHYDKAIESYRKLSLKYPKKNSYFASQIENIKKIQLNS